MIGYRNPPRYQIRKVMKNPSGLMLVDVGPGLMLVDVSNLVHCNAARNANFMQQSTTPSVPKWKSTLWYSFNVLTQHIIDHLQLPIHNAIKPYYKHLIEHNAL